MFGPFFGEYLVQAGIISENELDSAIQRLRKDNRLIGQLAVEQGFMSRNQVNETLQHQRRLDVPFGELCVELGHLTRQQLDELLFMQVRTNGYLGEMLVRMGHLDFENLGERLRDFDKLCESKRLEAESSLAGAGYLEVAMLLLRCLASFFLRRGLPTKFELIDSESVDLQGKQIYTLPMTIKAGHNGRGQHLVIVVSDKSFWYMVLEGRTIEDIDQELFLLNHVMSQSLGRAGSPAKPHIVLPYYPETTSAPVALQGHNATDRFWVLYHPPA